MEVGEGGGFNWGGVEGWGGKAHNCNWITIKNLKKRKKLPFIIISTSSCSNGSSVFTIPVNIHYRKLAQNHKENYKTIVYNTKKIETIYLSNEKKNG